MITKTKTEVFLDKYLDEYSFDELLEWFDLSPYEVLDLLFDEGLIDEEILDRSL